MGTAKIIRESKSIASRPYPPTRGDQNTRYLGFQSPRNAPSNSQFDNLPRQPILRSQGMPSHAYPNALPSTVSHYGLNSEACGPLSTQQNEVLDQASFARPYQVQQASVSVQSNNRLYPSLVSSGYSEVLMQSNLSSTPILRSQGIQLHAYPNASHSTVSDGWKKNGSDGYKIDENKLNSVLPDIAHSEAHAFKLKELYFKGWDLIAQAAALGIISSNINNIDTIYNNNSNEFPVEVKCDITRFLVGDIKSFEDCKIINDFEESKIDKIDELRKSVIGEYQNRKLKNGKCRKNIISELQDSVINKNLKGQLSKVPKNFIDFKKDFSNKPQKEHRELIIEYYVFNWEDTKEFRKEFRKQCVIEGYVAGRTIRDYLYGIDEKMRKIISIV